jgi:hypothetical protein
MNIGPSFATYITKEIGWSNYTFFQVLFWSVFNAQNTVFWQIVQP